MGTWPPDIKIAYRASSEASVAAMNAFGMDSKPQIKYPIEIFAFFQWPVY